MAPRFVGARVTTAEGTGGARLRPFPLCVHPPRPLGTGKLLLKPRPRAYRFHRLPAGAQPREPPPPAVPNRHVVLELEDVDGTLAVNGFLHLLRRRFVVGPCAVPPDGPATCGVIPPHDAPGGPPVSGNWQPSANSTELNREQHLHRHRYGGKSTKCHNGVLHTAHEVIVHASGGFCTSLVEGFFGSLTWGWRVSTLGFRLAGLPCRRAEGAGTVFDLGYRGYSFRPGTTSKIVLGVVVFAFGLFLISPVAEWLLKLVGWIAMIGGAVVFAGGVWAALRDRA